MRFHIIRTIFVKEMREVMRDKRTLFLIILLPFFLYPVLFFLIGSVGQSQQEKLEQKKVTVLLDPAARGTLVYDLLAADTSLMLRLQPVDRAALDTLDNTIGIEVDARFSAALDSLSTAPVRIMADRSDDLIDQRVGRLQQQFQQLGQQLLSQRLRTRNLSDAFARPLDVSVENIASKEKQIGKAIGGFLPFILLLFIFTGSIYIAIDITAGEKERRTLQSLFTAPLRVGEIIGGKFLAVFCVGLASALMNMLSMVVALNIQVQLLSEGSLGFLELSIPAVGWVLLLLIIILSTAFIAALCLGVVLLANSYKEAQSYVSPLMILLIIPAVLSQMPGMELNASTALIPFLNIALAMGAIFKGTMNLGLLALVTAFVLLYAGLALYLASLTFGNENVVTGEKVDFKTLLGRK